MFGMGFMEIFLIAIIAIVALGPDKLPKAMVEVARFLKKFKSGVEDAKSTLDNELNISEMKEEANKFKAQIEDAKSTVRMDNIDLGVNDLLKDDLDDDSTSEKKEKKSKKSEKVSFKSEKSEAKKKKKDKTVEIEEAQLADETKKTEETKANPADKFKVKQGEDA